MDTQGPRFEVFEQERPGEPHRNAGAVHAPDAELALLNARDVFSRRPQTVSLWVAPAASIYARTAEQLAAGAPDERGAAGTPQLFQVFQKLSQRRSETFVVHAGAVEGRTPAEALRRAIDRFGGQPSYVWWLVPDSAIRRSEPDQADSLFEPAHGKPFRHPNFYRVLTMMREVQAENEAGAQPPETAA